MAERLERAERKRLQVSERLASMAARRKDEDEARSYVAKMRKAALTAGAAAAAANAFARGPDGKLVGPSAVFKDGQSRFRGEDGAGPALVLSQEAMGIAEEIRKAKLKGKGSTFGYGDRWREGDEEGGGGTDEDKARPRIRKRRLLSLLL